MTGQPRLRDNDDDPLLDTRRARQRAEREIGERELEHEVEITRLVAGALEALSGIEGLLAQDDDDPGRHRQGTAAIARKLIAALHDAKVTLIGVAGEPFDPAIHRAVATAESPREPHDHVTQVLRYGYQYRGRIIPADVVVSAARDTTSAADVGRPVDSSPDNNEEHR